MPTLILVRHGQSLWNAENRFTGWVNIDLSEKGQKEAAQAGQLISHLSFGQAWTSVLNRAEQTLKIILDKNKNSLPQIQTSWRLNERHYGSLQGLNKKETALKYGEDQVFEWRRSFHTHPPLLSEKESLNQSKQPIFKDVPSHLFPRGESLKDTFDRVYKLWSSHILPSLKEDKNILIVAHGNSLRSLVKHIKKMSDSEITKFEFPTATPLKIKWKSHLEVENSIPFLFEFIL